MISRLSSKTILEGGVKLIKSMTSFGRAQSEDGKDSCFSIEMKSVNHRYLDMNIRMPRMMLALEEKIRNIISKKLSRGKVDVFINYKSYGNNTGKANLNMNLAKNYYECLKQIQQELDVIDDITATKIAIFPDVITVEEPEENLDNIFKELSPLVESALNLMGEMRSKRRRKIKGRYFIKSPNYRTRY